ncbi:HAD hydrolase-like protein [Streptomyces sp. NPDC005479]|uniref:HAD hydrolase-like protein n=1 Tax=unclassified Streptomyces TaxID=2593676 RepID=UPI0033AAE036
MRYRDLPRRHRAETRPSQTRNGLHPHQLIIGDSLENVRTGLEGGASIIGVTSGKTTGAELAAPGADITLDSLEAISKLRASNEEPTVRREQREGLPP